MAVDDVKLQAYLKLLHKTFSQTRTAEMLGVSRSTTRNWLTNSRRDQAAGLEQTSIYFMTFEDADRKRWFHQWANRSIKYSVELMEENLRNWATFGVEEIVRDTRGVPVWRRDPKLVGKPDLQKLCGQDDDLYRDADGNVVAETVTRRPPFDGVLKMIAAHMPKYRMHTQHDLNVSVGGGVMVLGADNANQRKPVQLEVIEQAVVEEVEVAQSAPVNDDVSAPAPSGPHPEVNRAQTPLRAELEKVWAAKQTDAERLNSMAERGGMRVS